MSTIQQIQTPRTVDMNVHPTKKICPGGLFTRVLDTMLPPRCVLCGDSSGSNSICDACKDDLPLTGPHCRTCGLPLAVPEDKTCGRCIQKLPLFTRTVSPVQYRFPVDRLIQAFKFKRQAVAGRVLSHLLCEYIIQHDIPRPDVLIPVPLHPWRMFRRGYNQAYELAAFTGRVLDIPLLAASLRRGRNTAAQSGLSRKQRRKNVRGAFYWQGLITSAPHVAIIDDVMTTGTTLTECARIVKKAGAKRVDVWVAARAIPTRDQ